MAIQVGKAITHNGIYYAAGSILPDSSYNESLARMFAPLGWRVVDSKPAIEEAPEPDDELDGLRKQELRDLAEHRGLEVPASATRKDLIDLLS